MTKRDRRVKELKSLSTARLNAYLPMTLLAILTTPVAGHTQDPAANCPALFSRSTPVKVHERNVSEVATGSMNEPSQEFLTRLQYLLSERRLLPTEALNALLASPQPVNPLGDRPSNVLTLPHQAAFQALLKRELQWNQIREAIRILISSQQKAQQRADTAKVETQDVLFPFEVKRFPFQVEHIVQTPTGQALGLRFATLGGIYNHATFFIAVDLATGTEVASIRARGMGMTSSVGIHSSQDSILVSMADGDTNSVITVDVLNKNSLPLAPVPPDSIDPRTTIVPVTVSKSFAVDSNGRPAIVSFQGNSAHVLDPLTGQHLLSPIPFGFKGFPPETSGALGNLVFASTSLTGTALIDASGAKPMQSVPGLMTLDLFKKSDRLLAFGVDLVAGVSLESSQKAVKLVDLSNEQEFPSVIVDVDDHLPQLMDHFEHDGRLYGLVATEKDFYLIDLIEGKIKRKLSDTPDASHLEVNQNVASRGQLAFTFKGRRYLLASSFSTDRSDEELVILDAMTLRPVSVGLSFPRKIHDIRRVPTNNGDIQFVVNYGAGISMLVSMVKRL